MAPRRLLLLFAATSWGSMPAEDPHAEFFEKRIRPVLVEHCYKCHSLESGKDKGGLRVDSRDALVHGGGSGPAVVPGDPAKSLLLAAIRQADPDTAMPPTGEPLPPEVVKDFESWINHGAVFPAALAAMKKDPREHWAFRPVAMPEVPAVGDRMWPRTDADRFLLAAMERAGIRPGGDAGTVELVRRLAVVLTGLPPTLDQQRRVASAAVLPAFVDELLASPAFGERWARHWMDLVRYAEGTGNEYDYEYQGTWQYRDYLVRAFNADLPYDHFLREHLIGDLLEPRLDGEGHNDALIATTWWNLGEAATAPVDIANDEAERLDNRIDVLGKTFNALTLGCARCHDHKFDPVSMREYYGIYGIVAASPTTRAWSNAAVFDRAAEVLLAIRHEALATVDARSPVPSASLATEGRVVADFAGGLPQGWTSSGHIEHVDTTLAPYLGLPPGLWSGTLSTRLPAVVRSPMFTITSEHVDVLVSGNHATVQLVLANLQAIRDPIYDGLHQTISGGDGTWRWHRFTVGRWKGKRAHLEIFSGTRDSKKDIFATHDHDDARFGVRAVVATDGARAEVPPGRDTLGLLAAEHPAALAARRDLVIAALPRPERLLAVAELDGQDLPVHARGDATKPRSDTAPRTWLAICGPAMPATSGSGRKELVAALLAEENPLTARVIVNRVWHHLFGRGLVPTTDNFGQLGEAPSHPALLDWLARRFTTVHRWRLKPLIRELVLGRTWQLAVAPAPEADATNRLLSRAPLRRMEGEAIRDAILLVAGTLDRRMGGPSVPVPHRLGEAGTGGAEYAPPSGPVDGERRRSLYLAVRRNYPNDFLVLFDLPATTGTFGRRDVSNVPTQALTLLNDPFVVGQAAQWGARIAMLAATPDERVARMFREAFAREATREETTHALALVGGRADGWADLALALINAKEFIHVR
jgi:hypothetical protein